MKPALEAPRPTGESSSLAVFQRREASFAWNWHYHPEIELTWIEKGRGTRLVGDHSAAYGPGDLVFLGPNLPHTWFSAADRGKTGDHRAVVVQFRPQILPQALLTLPEFRAIEILLSKAAEGLKFSDATGHRIGARMKALCAKKGFRQWAGLTAILNELAAAAATKLVSRNYWNHRSYKLSSRLERVLAHLDAKPREVETLSDAAKLAGLTPSAFSRFFRKMTRETFVGYRNRCRIREACRLLAETDLSVTDIAYESGFGNLANFNRCFRKNKNMVPREYRRLHNPFELRSPALKEPKAAAKRNGKGTVAR